MKSKTLPLFHVLVLTCLLASCKQQARLTEWRFEHKVLQDFYQLADAMNGECAIVDVNRDGCPDVWWSTYAFINAKWDSERYERHKDISQMAWYKGPEFKKMYRMHKGVTHGGNWIDLDGDGDLDCVTGRAINSGELIWLENPGQPETVTEWPCHSIYKGEVNPDIILFADLTNDNRKDIIIASFRQDVHFLITPIDVKTGHWELYHIAHTDKYRTGASVGDVDGDGDIDIVWGTGWLENPGDPKKVPWPDHLIDPDFHPEAQSVVHDLDRDGRSDIILASEEGYNGLAWYSRGHDAEFWIKHTLFADSSYSGLHSLRLADFDQDGDEDILTAEMHMSGYIKQVAPHKVLIYENVDISKNKWQEHIIAETGSHNAVVGDLNGDRYPDIIGSNWNNKLKECPLKADMWLNRLNQ